jgi:hypothetical protein
LTSRAEEPTVLDATTSLTFLWLWLAVAVLHGLWRSRGRAELDPVRPAGPLG